jgi:DNA-binding NarL/FixJ family response regulator
MSLLIHRNFTLLLILISFVIFFVIDLYIDLNEGVGIDHIWHEFIFLFLAMGAAIYQAWSVFKTEEELKITRNELLETKNSYKVWQTKSRSSAQELRRMIDQQFEEWELSQSEKEIALFLIKGLSMKEIADLRKTSDTTVRQQASVIYKKSSTSGRQELAAFFLEDILSVEISAS